MLSPQVFLEMLVPHGAKNWRMISADSFQGLPDLLYNR